MHFNPSILATVAVLSVQASADLIITDNSGCTYEGACTNAVGIFNTAVNQIPKSSSCSGDDIDKIKEGPDYASFCNVIITYSDGQHHKLQNCNSLNNMDNFSADWLINGNVVGTCKGGSDYSTFQCPLLGAYVNYRPRAQCRRR